MLTLEALPSEIVEKIAESLDHAYTWPHGKDVMNLRQTCRSINQRTARVFVAECFQDVTISVYVRGSLEKFDAMSKSDILSAHLQTVTVSGWHLHCSNCPANQFVTKAGKPRLPWFVVREKYNEHLLDQDWLVSTGNNIVMWLTALSRFQKCRNVRYWSGYCNHISELTRVAEDIIPEIKNIGDDDPEMELTERSAELSRFEEAILRPSHDFDMTRLMLNSIYSTTTRMSSLRMGSSTGYVESHAFAVPKPIQLSLQSRLDSLKELRMAAKAVGDTTPMLQFICSAKNVEILELYLSRGLVEKSLLTLIEGISLPKLEDLELKLAPTRFQIESAKIIALLERHSKTIRKLSLGEIWVTGSFIPCLQVMKDKMDLQELCFEHCDESTKSCKEGCYCSVLSHVSFRSGLDNDKLQGLIDRLGKPHAEEHSMRRSFMLERYDVPDDEEANASDDDLDDDADVDSEAEEDLDHSDGYDEFDEWDRYE